MCDCCDNVVKNNMKWKYTQNILYQGQKKNHLEHLPFNYIVWKAWNSYNNNGNKGMYTNVMKSLMKVLVICFRVCVYVHFKLLHHCFKFSTTFFFCTVKLFHILEGNILFYLDNRNVCDFEHRVTRCIPLHYLFIP